MNFGVDEAGRGPVIGSRFVSCVAVSDETSLPEGLDDSKRLTDAARADLANRLHDDDRVRVTVLELPPAQLDDPTYNLTEMTAHAMADVVDRIGIDTDDHGFIDACHPSAETYEDMFRDALDSPCDLTVEHKADETYPVVSAASVVAKEARENHVADLAEEYGEVGSGYPSDPTTRDFLRECLVDRDGFPRCVRQSWNTCHDIADEVGYEHEN